MAIEICETDGRTEVTLDRADWPEFARDNADYLADAHGGADAALMRLEAEGELADGGGAAPAWRVRFAGEPGVRA